MLIDSMNTSNKNRLETVREQTGCVSLLKVGNQPEH